MWWTAVDYDKILPLLARLPTSYGYWFSQWRGLLYALLKRDWRIVTGVDADVDLRTTMALALLYPQASINQQRTYRRQRYQAQAIAEWTSERLAQHIMQVRSPVLPQLPNAAIYITAHYGASIEAAYWIEQQSGSGLLMTSNIVAREDIPLSIQHHYQRKYAPLSHQDVETAPNAFLRQLKKGKSIILLADLPGDIHHCTSVETALGIANLASGARRLAQASGVPLIAYTAIYNARGQWQFSFSPLCYVSKDDGSGYEPAYHHLTSQLLAHPEHWWAMDLLPLWYPR